MSLLSSYSERTFRINHYDPRRNFAARHSVMAKMYMDQRTTQRRLSYSVYRRMEPPIHPHSLGCRVPSVLPPFNFRAVVGPEA